MRERLQGHAVCGTESESPCPCTGCCTLTAWSLGALTEAALDVVAVPDILLFPLTSLSVKLAALAEPGAGLLAWDLLAADVFYAPADAGAPLPPELPLSVHCRDRGSWACTKERSQQGCSEEGMGAGRWGGNDQMWERGIRIGTKASEPGMEELETGTRH